MKAALFAALALTATAANAAQTCALTETFEQQLKERYGEQLIDHYTVDGTEYQLWLNSITGTATIVAQRSPMSCMVRPFVDIPSGVINKLLRVNVNAYP